jgi:hypothetical protein
MTWQANGMGLAWYVLSSLKLLPLWWRRGLLDPSAAQHAVSISKPTFILCWFNNHTSKTPVQNGHKGSEAHPISLSDDQQYIPRL